MYTHAIYTLHTRPQHMHIQIHTTWKKTVYFSSRKKNFAEKKVKVLYHDAFFFLTRKSALKHLTGATHATCIYLSKMSCALAAQNFPLLLLFSPAMFIYFFLHGGCRLTTLTHHGHDRHARLFEPASHQAKSCIYSIITAEVV